MLQSAGTDTRPAVPLRGTEASGPTGGTARPIPRKTEAGNAADRTEFAWFMQN